MIFVESLIVFAIIAIIWLMITVLIFKRLNKAKIKGVVLILLAFVGVGAALFAVGHFLEWHETSEFCTSMGCHAMDPVYDSYTQPDNNSYMETHYEHNVTCAQCHSGSGLTGLGESFLVVPGEVWGQYIAGYDADDLGGHVPSENCLKGCHEHYTVDWKFEAPNPKGKGYSLVDGEQVWLRMDIFHPHTVNGTDLSELEELEDCQHCHDPRDNGFGLAAEACPICHDVDEEEIQLHGEYTCVMSPCHRDAEGNPVQPKRRGHADVKEHCTSCHDRDHPEDATVPYTVTTEMGEFQANMTFCSGCHHEAYDELEEYDSKHFSDNECQECHLEHKNRPDCLMCHDEGGDYEPTHTIISPFDECGGCHVEGGHNPLTIDFQTQDSRNVSRDFCNDCHQTDVYDEFDGGELHSREEFTEDCLACHNEHELDVDCLSCHSEGGFGGEAEEPGHSVSAPFDECLDCHIEGHNPSELNFTFFSDEQQITIEDDFCVNCHYEDENQFHLPQQQQLTSYGFNHSLQDCSLCHESHEAEDVDCLMCHDDSTAPLPPHSTQNQYEDCTDCHESGHAPRDIMLGASGIQNDFCADISCHGETGGQVETLQNYGGDHDGYDCTVCHKSHISYDSELTLEFDCLTCHGDSPAAHAGPYTFEDCLACHNSAHDPTNRVPSPGYNLSQRDYMSQYFTIDQVVTSNSFSWINRGGHEAYTNCSQCHSNAERAYYTAPAQSLMNVNSTDCSTSCHTWIDTQTTGTPFTLLTSSPNTFTKHRTIFDNTTTGGCAGFCHQPNPTSPAYDGTGHATVTNCLNSDCHGNSQGFEGTGGDIHDKHREWLEEAGVACFEVCHKSSGESYEPINPGCYECHKSGHNPKIMNTSPCYSCHMSNVKP